MKYLFNIIVCLISVIILVGCKQTGISPKDSHNFKKILVKGGDFWITTYQKITNEHEPYVFYIEGDGFAFNNKYTPSSDPTPREPMLINLAIMDERPNIVYIARPCQYTPMDLNPKCNKQYWTSKRLSDDSVHSINDVINHINHNNKFSLIGYSGGGGIAILVAARNNMVRDIITIAGNLDIVMHTKYHNVSLMAGSLNPIDYAKQLNHIPQLHLSGKEDKVVPTFIANEFVQSSSSTCVKQEIFPEVNHRKGWGKIWKSVYTRPLTCKNTSL